MDAWDQHVLKWEGWATEVEMQVEFVWWGSSELLDLLSQQRHVGRLHYWFGQYGFDQEWFERRLDDAIRVAVPRYNRDAHVELDITKQLKLFGRCDEAAARVESIADGIRKALDLLRIPEFGAVGRSDLRDLIAAGDRVLEEFAALELTIAADLEIDAIIARIDDVAPLALEARPTLEQLGEFYGERADSQPEGNRRGTRPYVRVARDVEDFGREIDSAREALCEVARLFNSRVLLLSGVAGAGKTHLLCDFAQQRVDAGLPAVVLMGQRFTETSEPWNQALQHIGMHSAQIEQFVGALEASAQASDSRALVMVDALNEGRGIDIWPKHLSPFLARLETSPWIAVVVSVRSAYEDAMIPEDVRQRAVRLTHLGFEGHEYEAVQTLFAHYGLEVPSSPLLHTEYRNPLYLTTVCEGLSRSGVTTVPKGLQGITDVFDLYFDAINKELAERLDYNRDDNLVKAALSALAERMATAEVGWLTRQTTEELVNQFLPDKPFSVSLYHGLVTAGVLIVDLHRDSEGQREEVAFAAYERFTDHIVAATLLRRWLASQAKHRVSRWLSDLCRKGSRSVRRLVSRNGTGQKGSFDFPAWLSRTGRPVSAGVLEALCIQTPELIGREFVRIVPQYQAVSGIDDAFLESIAWRRSDAFDDDTLKVFNEVVTRGTTKNEPYDSLIAVSAVPDHPMNAEFFDRILHQDDMPHRDVWWSTYLDRSWYTEGPVHRLVHWASAVSPELALDEEVIDLAAIGLAWMLTTPNRYVRDGATKALVALLTDRIPSMERLLERFHCVDDPYVAERVYAVAYGVAMRSHDVGDVERMARQVYAKVFANGAPPPHILLRDYARGVVERAFHLNTSLEVDLDLQLVRPTYESCWTNIPDEDAVRQLDERMCNHLDKGNAAECTWCTIRFSVTSGSFARNVLGANLEESSRDWLSLTLDAPPWVPPEQRRDDLMAGLDHMESSAWDAFQASSRAAMRVPDLPDWLHRGHDEIPVNKPRDTGEPDDAYCLFVASLSDQHYCEWVGLEAERPGFDLSIVQNYVLDRVVSLGWTVERFGEFDRLVSSRERPVSESRKAERMGKKYQWIAYHEILALISDHFQFHGGWGESKYSGLWETGYRDIDPSAVPLRKSPMISSADCCQPTWWSPVEFEAWHPELPATQWLADCSYLPAFEGGLVVSDPSDPDVVWINCYIHQEWREPHSSDLRVDDAETRNIWARVAAYLVPEGRANDFVARVLAGGYRDDPGDSPVFPFNEAFEIFFGEYGWSPAYLQLCGGELPSEIRSRFPPGLQSPLAVKVADCGLMVPSDYNSPGDWKGHELFYIPDYTIAQDCGLRWTGFGGDYVDSGSNIACFDPSAHEEGPEGLLFRSEILASYLTARGLELCWAVSGEKLSVSTSSQQHGRLRFQGGYMYRNGRAVGTLKTTYRSATTAGLEYAAPEVVIEDALS